ncbi:hypothetical protein [Ulvibacterium sp.]|uniref:hypothetical protein n=1 Tax=Ulvibacterium sp. TaxID=2665914 RepID=UPI003CC66BCA
MKAPAKIKAGALQFVLFIGAIIAILLFSFVLISYTHSFFGKKTDLTVDIIQETEYGLQYAYQRNMGVGEILQVPTNRDTDISITVQKTYWGIFEKYVSIAEQGKQSFSKLALSGNRYPDGLPALYLRDKQRPLIIAGNSKITGDAYLPQQGIRMGNISGNSYRHSRLVHGRERQSKTTMPKLAEETIGEINRLLNANQSGESTIPLRPKMEVKNSFASPTVHINDYIIELESVSLTGNIKIMASHKLVVHPTAMLRDVVLVAPEIEIRDGVKGYFQAIASKKIHMGKHCELAYPSALVVKEKQSNRTPQNRNPAANLFVDDQSVVNGIVLYLDESEERTYAPQLKISENALVRGQVYCTENLELPGTILGNATTDAFIALANGSIYQNHLYNGHIDSAKLPLAYVGLPIAGSGDKKTMKWLY